MANKKFWQWLVWWVTTLSIFIVDILTPLGVAGGVPYVAIVLLTIWSKNKNVPVWAGFFGTFLTIVGYYFSSTPEVPLWIVLANRMLALFGIWSAVIVIRLYLQSQLRLQETKDQMHAFLQKKNEELSRSNQDLEKFAFIASHDLQEPIRKIKAFLSRVKESSRDKLTEEEMDYLERSLNGAYRLQGLIDDLLTFSRVGRNVDMDQEVDLKKIMDEVQDGLDNKLKESGGEIFIENMPGVKGNKNLLYQLFQNLAQNALKFSAPGRTPQIWVKGKIFDHNLLITVKDNGVGIPENEVEKVFDIFYRTHENGKIKGSGIGLAICKKIVELNGGEIWLESQVGKGSSFFIEFPPDKMLINNHHKSDQKEIFRFQN